MKAFRIASPILAVVLTLCASWLSSAARAQEDLGPFGPPPALKPGVPHLYLVMLADTLDPAIGDSTTKDIGIIVGMFHENMPDDRLRTKVLRDRDALPETALQAIRSLDVAAGQDTVVFYYSGHGGFDETSHGHMFFPSQKNMYRKDVREAIAQKNPRLAVIISDTCSVFIKVPVPPPSAGAPHLEEPTPIFQALFFRPQGLVDIGSTQPGQEAWGDSNGGLFTRSLGKYIGMNRDKSPNWSEVLQAVDKTVPELDANAKQRSFAVSPLPGTNIAGPSPVGVLPGVPRQPLIPAPTPTPSPSPADREADLARQWAVTVKENVQLHWQTPTGAPLVITLGAGEILKIRDRNGQWLMLERHLRTDKKTVGWVLKDDVAAPRPALTWLADQILRQPARFDLYRARSELLDLVEDIDGAMRDADQAIRLKPDDAETWRIRTDLWQAKRNFEKALADAGEALRLDPSEASYLCRANVFSDKGDFDKAVADYDSALRLNADCDRAYAGRGFVRMIKGELDKALADCDAAIRLSPKDAWYYYQRGNVLQQKLDFAKARAAYEEALRLHSSNEFTSMVQKSLGELKAFESIKVVPENVNPGLPPVVPGVQPAPAAPPAPGSPLVPSPAPAPAPAPAEPQA